MSNHTVPGWATVSSEQLRVPSKNIWRWNATVFERVSQEREKKATSNSTCHSNLQVSFLWMSNLVSGSLQNANCISSTVLHPHGLIFAFMWWKTWHVALSFFFCNVFFLPEEGEALLRVWKDFALALHAAQYKQDISKIYMLNIEHYPESDFFNASVSSMFQDAFFFFLKGLIFPPFSDLCFSSQLAL